MKVSLTGEAELELVDGAQYYTREADARLGNAFISEFERCVELLRQYPEFGAKWRGSTRRLPLRSSWGQVLIMKIDPACRFHENEFHMLDCFFEFNGKLMSEFRCGAMSFPAFSGLGSDV